MKNYTDILKSFSTAELYMIKDNALTFLKEEYDWQDQGVTKAWVLAVLKLLNDRNLLKDDI